VPSAQGADCGTSGSTEGGFLGVRTDCAHEGSIDPGTPAVAEASNQPAPYERYRWVISCFGSSPESPTRNECAGAQQCPDPLAREFRLWGQASGEWAALGTSCFGGTPEEYVPPEVTPGDVLSALRRVGLPSLTVETQPAGETLVNLDTIFFTDPQPVSVDLTILGQAVDVVATPSGYEWSFGDGQGMSTTSPGSPYPTPEITHRYSEAQVTVEPSVAVSYTARFRVSGGAWQDIDGTVTSPGPGTSLLVSEATPLLSGAGS
jgi:hypothetical protein